MIVVYLLGCLLSLSNLRLLYGNPCKEKSYGINKIVCVCNSNYCDELTTPSITSGEYLMLTSTEQGDRFKMQLGTLSTSLPQNYYSTRLMMDPTKSYQTIIGFGGALSDAAAINFRSISRPAQTYLKNSYFSKSGIEYNMVRVPIASTDFSTSFYTYDDSAEPDPQLKKFKLRSPEDTLYKIPLIKEFQEINPDIHLFATAWTAPTWMKDNVTKLGPFYLKKQYYETWAKYHMKFLRAYKEYGIDFWAITSGNEPTTGLHFTTVETLGYYPNQLADFIANNLGPTLRSSEFKSLKLLTIDDQLYNFPAYIWGIYFSNAKAKQYVDGYALHWYWNGVFPYGLLSVTHNMYPNQFIIATEASEGFLDHEIKYGDWSRAESYAFDIMKDMHNWVTGWVDWNMALDTEGGPTYVPFNRLDSPVIVNNSANEFYKQPMFYAVGHFSKFVPRNSTRIDIRHSLVTGLDMVGFRKPDGCYVAVIMNRQSTSKNIILTDPKGKGLAQKILPKSINTILFS